MKRLKKANSNKEIVELANKLNEAAQVIWEASEIWGRMNDELHEIVSEVFEKKLAYNLTLFADSLENSAEELKNQ